MLSDPIALMAFDMMSNFEKVDSDISNVHLYTFQKSYTTDNDSRRGRKSHFLNNRLLEHDIRNITTWV